MNMLQMAEEGNGEKLEEMLAEASLVRSHWRMGQKAK